VSSDSQARDAATVYRFRSRLDNRNHEARGKEVRSAKERACDVCGKTIPPYEPHVAVNALSVHRLCDLCAAMTIYAPEDE